MLRSCSIDSLCVFKLLPRVDLLCLRRVEFVSLDSFDGENAEPQPSTN
jgi:hypothetical protein